MNDQERQLEQAALEFARANKKRLLEFIGHIPPAEAEAEANYWASCQYRAG